MKSISLSEAPKNYLVEMTAKEIAKLYGVSLAYIRTKLKKLYVHVIYCSTNQAKKWSCWCNSPAGFLGIVLFLVCSSCRSCCTTTHIHRYRTVPSGRCRWQSVPRFNLSSQIEEPCEVGVGANKTLMGVSQVFSVFCDLQQSKV
jgi:hypothetical protein